jgi:hypothetical protein
MRSKARRFVGGYLVALTICKELAQNLEARRFMAPVRQITAIPDPSTFY